MKIALFGGTGPTGRHIIEEALRQGYKLSVYTRDAGKLSSFGSKIEVVVGDLNNREAIRACVAGADAVISALGPNSLKAREKRPIMRGVGTIISVMEELNVRRLIQISTAIYRDPKDGFDFKSQAFVMLFKIIAQSLAAGVRSVPHFVFGGRIAINAKTRLHRPSVRRLVSPCLPDSDLVKRAAGVFTQQRRVGSTPTVRSTA